MIPRIPDRPALDINELEHALNRLLSRGRVVEAYGRYYGDGTPPPQHGNRRSEEAWVVRFLYWAERFIAASPVRWLVIGEASYSEWLVPAANAATSDVRRLVTRKWRGGRVLEESVQDVPRVRAAPDMETVYE